MLFRSHREDILCIAKSQGDLIATSDYGGTIIVWNVSSKKIFTTLTYIDSADQTSKGNKSICSSSPHSSLPLHCLENANNRVIRRVLFIHPRFNRRETANLITSGPYGRIHFWNIYQNGVLMAKFRPVRMRRAVSCASST